MFSLKTEHSYPFQPIVQEYFNPQLKPQRSASDRKINHKHRFSRFLEANDLNDPNTSPIDKANKFEKRSAITIL